MRNKLDLSKILLGIIAIVIGGVSAYYGQPLIHKNDQAINLIVTVFSVLSGFLIAIIAIIGDPMLLPPGTWRAAEMGREKLEKKLVRHKFLFFLYLLTLGVVFLTLLFKDDYLQLTVWLERIFLFSGTAAFFCSTWLPGSLMKGQQDKINAVIEHRRSEAGIKS